MVGELIHFSERMNRAGGDQVGDLDDVFAAIMAVIGFLGPLALNILSIRSVITNPPTTLLVAAMIAMVPSTVASVLSLRAGQDDRADHRDRIQRVGQRHQRRVEQRRDPPDHLEADESRQHEDVEAVIRSSFIVEPPGGRQRRHREELAARGR